MKGSYEEQLAIDFGHNPYAESGDALENDMVRLIRKTENAADPNKGWVKPNPWEKGLKDKNGIGLETFDVDVDGVKIEIYHPEGLGTINGVSPLVFALYEFHKWGQSFGICTL